MGKGRGMRRAAWLAAACLMAAPAAAQATPGGADYEPGDLWETSISMTMQGMEGFALPGQTVRVCAPKGQEPSEPPGMPDEGDCKLVHHSVTAGKMTWRMECTKPRMTGTGEMVYSGRDSYEGSMIVVTDEGTMNMKMSGRRIGDCNAAETKRQVARLQQQAEAAQAQHADSMEKVCQDAAVNGALALFTGPGAMCTEPRHRQAFCDALATEKGFSGVSPRAGEPAPALADAAAFCGKSADALRTELCEKALEAESLDFLGRQCPAEAQVIAQRECAGRSYTSLTGSRYQAFCVNYARESLGAGRSSSNPAPPEDPVQKGKKLIKGLLGR